MVTSQVSVTTDLIPKPVGRPWGLVSEIIFVFTFYSKMRKYTVKWVYT